MNVSKITHDNYKMAFPIVILILQLLVNLRGFEKIIYLNSALLIVVILLQLFTKFDLRKVKSTYYLILYMLIILISISNSHNFNRVFSNFSCLFLIMAFFWSKSIRQNRIYLYKVIDQLKCFFLIIVFLNLYQIIFRKPILGNYLTSNINSVTYQFGTSNYRALSVFGNSLVAGTAFLISIIFVLYLIDGKNKVIVIMLALVDIYSTQSRSSWIALIVIFVLIMLKKTIGLLFNGRMQNLRINTKLVLISPIIVMFLILLVIYVPHTQIFSDVFLRFGDSLNINNSTDISNLQRIGGLKLVLSNISGIHWLVGYGNGAIENLLMANKIVISNFGTLDNQYFTILYENGILGVIVILIPLFISLKRYLLNFNNNKYGDVVYLSCIGLYMVFFFYEGMYWNTIGTIFAIFISFVMYFDSTLLQKERLYG